MLKPASRYSRTTAKCIRCPLAPSRSCCKAFGIHGRIFFARNSEEFGGFLNFNAVILFGFCVFAKSFYFYVEFIFVVVVVLDVRLFVDCEEISLNKFVVKILGGTVVGVVSALRGVKEDWKEIRVEVKR